MKNNFNNKVLQIALESGCTTAKDLAIFLKIHSEIYTKNNKFFLSTKIDKNLKKELFNNLNS